MRIKLEGNFKIFSSDDSQFKIAWTICSIFSHLGSNITSGLWHTQPGSFTLKTSLEKLRPQWLTCCMPHLYYLQFQASISSHTIPHSSLHCLLRLTSLMLCLKPGNFLLSFVIDVSGFLIWSPFAIHILSLSALYMDFPRKQIVSWRPFTSLNLSKLKLHQTHPPIFLTLLLPEPC